MAVAVPARRGCAQVAVAVVEVDASAASTSTNSPRSGRRWMRERRTKPKPASSVGSEGDHNANDFHRIGAHADGQQSDTMHRIGPEKPFDSTRDVRGT